MKLRPCAGLWSHTDFLKLWAGQTISVFGSLVGRTALPFTAILVLDAGSIEVSLLRAAELLPGLALGLAVGVWVDRLRRRPIMIVADIGRAFVLATVPLAAAFDALRIEQLYVVGLLVGALTIAFDVAYQAYLPSLVRRDALVDANSKLTASASVAEVTSFGSAGALVQLLTAPGAIAVDSVSFLVSAGSIAAIREPEPPVPPVEAREPLRRELGEGWRVIWGDPVLRALGLATLTFELAFAVGGAVYMLFVTRELGFSPAPLGLIFAVGGVSSLFGAWFAGRFAGRWPVGRVLIGATFAVGVGMLFLPFAPGATVVGVALLVGQQVVADWAMTVFEIYGTSLRQGMVDDAVLGRVNATLRVGVLAVSLAGVLAGGLLGEFVGLRATLVLSPIVQALAVVWLVASPVRGLRRMPIREVAPAAAAAG